MRLKKITIAPIKMARMVSFYNAVFGANLIPYEAFGTTLYNGKLAGLELQFCPNELLQIKAEKNRQQLSFVIDDGQLEQVIAQVLAHGGAMLGEIQQVEHGRACGIIDPDGNSIELTT